MIFTDFLKAREEKNKYGMIPQNYNRRTNVAMEHNSWLIECFKHLHYAYNFEFLLQIPIKICYELCFYTKPKNAC
jgi:hypothetical protein